MCCILYIFFFHLKPRFEVKWDYQPADLISCTKLTAISALPPKIAYDKTAYFTEKFGPALAPAVVARVRRDAAALGLRITLEGRTGRTRDSHALLLLAQRRSQRHLVALQTVLFRGAFERGRDVSDRGFLLEAAREAGLLGPGLDQDDVLAWLDGEQVREMVDGLERQAKEVMGITAVPTFVVQGKYRVGGKQEEKVFLDLFDRIRKDESVGMGP